MANQRVRWKLLSLMLELDTNIPPGETCHVIPISGATHSIYIFRDDSGRACYVGYGQSSDEALANMAATHLKTVRELLKSQSLTLEIAGPFESKETALAVETALIAALAPIASSARGQSVHRFRPLGVPPQFAARVAMAPLGRDDLIEILDKANSPSFLCVFLDSLNFEDENGQIRRGFEPLNPPSDEEVLQRLQGWWRLQFQLETWRRNPMQSPAILLGVHGKPEHQFIVASALIDRDSWEGARRSAADEDCYEVPVKPAPNLDAAQLRGRRISRKAGLKFNADGVKVFP